MKNKIYSLIVPTLSLILSSCGNYVLKNEISQNDWNANRRFVTLSTGVKMCYVEMGDPKGQPIVLQHGMTDNSRSWSLAAPYFAKAGYHVYIPDLRGQGQSSYMEGHYTTYIYANDLNAFFEAKHIDKAVVVGHSLGSFTMQTFWLMYPEKVEKAVLVSSAPLIGYNAARMEYMLENYVKPLPEDGHLPDSFMDGWYDCSSDPVEEEILGETFDTFLANMKKEAQSLSKKAWINIILGLMESNFCGFDESVTSYSQFDKTKKCLILHGETDTMAISDYQNDLIEYLSNEQGDNVTYYEYEGVGHNIQFVTPKRCANDIISWLDTGVLPEYN